LEHVWKIHIEASPLPHFHPSCEQTKHELDLPQICCWCIIRSRLIALKAGCTPCEIDTAITGAHPKRRHRDVYVLTRFILTKRSFMPPSWLAELKEKLLPSTRRRLEDFF
jgi:hypothetical protein